MANVNDELGSDQAEIESQGWRDLPSSAEIAEACKDVLPAELCQDIAAEEPEAAFSLAFAALIESVDENGDPIDPTEFFRQKGFFD